MGKKHCDYCKGEDLWDREVLESEDGSLRYGIGNGELIIEAWSGYYEPECEWQKEIKINYCPICRKEIKNRSIKRIIRR